MPDRVSGGAWPLGYDRCSGAYACCFCQSRSLAYWIWQVPASCSCYLFWFRSLAFWIWQLFAYLCSRLVPFTQPGLLDTTGSCLSVLKACTDLAAWPIGYGRPLYTCALDLLQSPSLGYWIRQAFAFSCFRLVPITQPGLLDRAGVCIPVHCVK